MAWILWRAVLNDGDIFRVEIEPQDLVLELQEAVARKMGYTKPAHQLWLYLAKKNEIYDLLQPELFLSLASAVQDAISMEGPAPTTRPVIHLLVKTPGLQEPTTLWAFNGSIGNARRVKGARARVYVLAESFAGYYDSILWTASASDKAMWYDGDALQISILFEKEELAMCFDSRLRVEARPQVLPLAGLPIAAAVVPTRRVLTASLRPVLPSDYVAQESESPPVRLISSIKSVNFSSVDVLANEFSSQRLSDS